MRLIGRILAIALVLMVPLLLMVAACNLALYNTMSNERTYRDAFVDRSLLNDITPLAIPALFNASDGPLASYSGGLSMQRLIDTIGFENWNTLMSEVVSASWMQARFDQILRLFTGILKNDYTTLDESVDVESVQARLQGDSGQSLAVKFVNFAPACTAAQDDALRVFQSTSAGDYPLCKSSDEGLQAFSVSHLTGWLSVVGDQLESVSASQFFDLTTTEARGLHVILKLDEQTSYVLYLCPGAFLALIVFFTVRSFRSFSRWIGGTLLLSGIGVLVALLGIQIGLVNLFSAASRSMNESERLFTQIVVSLMRSGMGGISQSMLLQAGLMIMVGFGLFALASLIARNELVATGTTVLVTEDGQVISSTSLPTIPTETSSASRRTPVE